MIRIQAGEQVSRLNIYCTVAYSKLITKNNSIRFIFETSLYLFYIKCLQPYILKRKSYLLLYNLEYIVSAKFISHPNLHILYIGHAFCAFIILKVVV